MLDVIDITNAGAGEILWTIILVLVASAFGIVKFRSTVAKENNVWSTATTETGLINLLKEQLNEANEDNKELSQKIRKLREDNEDISDERLKFKLKVTELEHNVERLERLVVELQARLDLYAPITKQDYNISDADPK